MRRTSINTIALITMVLTGCDSQIHLVGTPQYASSSATAMVQATAIASASGQAISIADPTSLPAAVRLASSLKVAFGAVEVPVTRLPNGAYSFFIPAGSNAPQDVSGNLEVVFVMDDRLSQLVLLSTGSPVQFGQPPVQTSPASGTIAQGLDIFLTANTVATETDYDFTWSASPSANGPWSPIPGDGKQVKFTPVAAGNYYIMVNAVDRKTQQSYSAVTPSAVVFVIQPKDTVTTVPTSGSIERGNTVTLKFNTPQGLTGTNLSYAWSYGQSANGPWTTITGNAAQIDWLPTDVGSYFIKTDVSNKDTGAVNTFVTPQAEVFVTESKPIVTSDHPIANRGDRVNLTLNVTNPGAGPFTWYYARSAGAANSGGSTSLAGSSAGTFVPLVGHGTTISTVATDVGSYNFRVDIPQTDGSVKSFVTTNPVLNVQEAAPIIHTVPPFASFPAGSSTTLQLEAAGVDTVNYRYIWYLATNPAAGWTSLPFDSSNDEHAKTYTITGLTSSRFASGSYYGRVDAIAVDGSVTYSFISTSTVLTISNVSVR